MGRPVTLKGEDVFKLCDTLMLAGTAPSIRRIQQELGGASSSVAEYLRVWWKQRNEASAAIEMSDDFKALYNRDILDAYHKGKAERDSELASVRETNSDLLKELNQNAAFIEELQNVKKDLELKLVESSSESKFMAQEIEKLKFEMVELKAEKTKLESDRRAAERTADRFEGRLQELERQIVKETDK